MIEYRYVLHRTLKNGTPVEYDCVIKYTPKKPKKIIEQSEIDLIKQKHMSGVTKRRICEDHKISTFKLRRILA